MSTRRTARAVAIVAGLSALAGAVCGVVFLLGVAAVDARTVSVSAGDLLDFGLVAAAFGAGLGLVLGLALSFGLLRAVPLGRAIFGTAAGALVAFTLVVFAHRSPWLRAFGGWNAWIGAAIGALVTALFLRWRYAEAPARAGAPAENQTPL